MSIQALKEKGAQSLGREIFDAQTNTQLLHQTIAECLEGCEYEFLIEIIGHCSPTASYSRKKYISVAQPSYELKERTFDRFAEMLIAFEIEDELFLPLIVMAAAGSFGAWKAPAEEFLINYAKSNHQRVWQLIEARKDWSELFFILIRADRLRARQILCNKVFEDRLSRLNDYKPLLRAHRDLILPPVIERLEDASPSIRECAYKILLLFKDVVAVQDILRERFEFEQNLKLKHMIMREVGIAFKPSFESISQLEEFCRNQAKRFDAPKMKLSYNNCDQVPQYVQHFLLFALENGFIDYARAVAQHLSNPELEDEAFALIKGFSPSIKEWKARFGLLFGAGRAASLAIGVLTKNLLVVNAKNAKDYIQLIEHLAYSPELAAGEFLEEILRSNKAGKAAKRTAENAFCEFAKNNSFNQDELADEFADKFEGVKITNDLQAVIDLDEITPFFSNIGAAEQELERQIERFFCFYRFGREYSARGLGIIMGNKALNKIAETLFWGIYNAKGQLVDVFVIDGGKLWDLKGKEFALPEGAVIKIVHPIDLDFKYQHLMQAQVFQPFNQLNRPFYLMTQEDIMQNRAVRFAGKFTTGQKFEAAALATGFTLGKIEDGKGVCFKALGGILAEADILKSENEVRLGYIRFFDTQYAFEGGASLLTENALELGKINPRVFSEALVEIFSLFA